MVDRLFESRCPILARERPRSRRIAQRLKPARSVKSTRGRTSPARCQGRPNTRGRTDATRHADDPFRDLSRRPCIDRDHFHVRHTRARAEGKMQVKGLDPAVVRSIVSEVSRRYFAGNLGFNRAPEAYRGSVRFTLRVADARGPGHRRGTFARDGHAPKRLVAACYHGYGEVIRGLLNGGATWVQT